MHVPGRRIALANVGLTRVQDDFVQLKKTIQIRCLFQQRRQFRKVMSVLSGADFVKDLAQAVNVRLGAAGSFRWNKSFCADIGPGFIDVGDQSNVGELWHAVDKDNVRGFDVAMNQPMGVQRIQSGAQRQTELHAFIQRKSSAQGDLLGHGLRNVETRVDILVRGQVVPQLHDVIEIAPFHILAYVQNVHETFVGTRNGFKLLDPGEFPFEGPLVPKAFAMDHFDRAIHPHQIAGQPHFPVTATADTLD